MAADIGILDQVTQQILDVVRDDAHRLQIWARWLLVSLAAIQLCWSNLWMALAGESLQQVFYRNVLSLFSFGFLFGLINFGGQWVPIMLNGFIQLGEQSGVSSLDPSSIIEQGLSISGAIFKGIFNWGLLTHLYLALMAAAICISIIVMYALIAAELTIVLVKSHIVTALCSLFFAFGGLEQTREMTFHYIKATLGIGLNLMALYLLIGVGEHIGSKWAVLAAKASEHHELTPMLVIMAAVTVYYMMIKNIPPFIAGLSGVGGFRNYGGAAVGMALHAGMSGAGLGLQAATHSQALLSNVKPGLSAVRELGKGFYHGYQQGGKPWSGLAKGTGMTMKHMMQASANTVKDTMTQQNATMNLGQKLHQHMANSVNASKSSVKKPNVWEQL